MFDAATQDEKVIILCTWVIYVWLCSSCGPCPLFQFLYLYTVGRTSWRRDECVTGPLPTHRINADDTDIHASSGIRTHDRSVRAGEDDSCLRPLGHCERPSDVDIQKYGNLLNEGRARVKSFVYVCAAIMILISLFYSAVAGP
jgi:hypothetical protein